MKYHEYKNKIKLAKKYSDEYYNSDSHSIPDYIYDSLIEEIENYEKNNEVSSDSITKSVGSPPKGKKKILHTSPMLSLKKTYDSVAAMDWLRANMLDDDNMGFIITPKIDGVAVSIRYENGRLLSAATRGDSTTGLDITDKIKVIEKIPKKIDYLGDIEIRGELTYPNSEYNHLCEVRELYDGKVFSSPRTATNSYLFSGKSFNFMFLPPVSDGPAFYPYDLVEYKNTKIALESYDRILDFLNEIFYNKMEYIKITSIETMPDIYSIYKTKKDIELDGIVMRANSLKLCKSLGSNKRYPLFALAYKFKSDSFFSKIIDIKPSYNNGVITPVATIERKNYDNITINSLNLYNYDYVTRNDIREGDSVEFKILGNSSPSIINIKKGNRGNGDSCPILPPTNCPECNKILTKFGMRLYCELCKEKKNGT